MKQMPPVHKYMTALPHTIGNDIPIKTALELMRENRIRHLPVQKGGKLVGMLTDRDVKFAASFSGSEEFKAEDVMTPDPFTAGPDMPLDKVVLQMAEHKYGSAVIVQPNGKVVGIFTAVDGLRVLAETLSQFYKHGADA